MRTPKWMVLVVLLSFLPRLNQASSEIKEGAPNIYLECNWCSMNYIRENVSFVNFVRDKTDADIHIFTSRLRTGSGGREYSMIFIGHKRFAGIKDTLKYYTNKTDTDKSKRLKMLRTLKRGLFRFLYKTEFGNNFRITFLGNKNSKKKGFLPRQKDPWDFWVFRTSLNTRLSVEKSLQSKNIYGSFSASRVTEESKLGFYFGGNYRENDFNYGSVNYKDIRRGEQFFSYYTKSIGKHWAAQIAFSGQSSTYSNIDFSGSLRTGIEYDYFPYSIASSKRAVVRYSISGKYNNYSHLTIYGKNQEYLLNQSISAMLVFIADWGTISTRFSFQNYLHDFSKNSAEISSDLEFKLFKGLSLNFEGNFEAIHDQIELSAEEATAEEILLRRRELETQYNLYVKMGFSYTFGSIYNNIVNPRFEMY